MLLSWFYFVFKVLVFFSGLSGLFGSILFLASFFDSSDQHFINAYVVLVSRPGIFKYFVSIDSS